MQSESRTDHKDLRKDRPGNSSFSFKHNDAILIESNGKTFLQKGLQDGKGHAKGAQDAYPYAQDGDYEYPGEGLAANGGNGIRNGGIYRIRSQYPGTWFNAELSWDGVGSSHPMAILVETNGVSWKFDEKIGGQNEYIISSQHPGAWFGAELSWDTQSPHPMASVKNNDRVYWQLVPKGEMVFRIVSKYPDTWFNAELSWDDASPHPMASVEHNDPVDWKLVEVPPS